MLCLCVGLVMNDFTKEELLRLMPLLAAACETVTYKTDDYHFWDKLHDKTQSLIDNYCEHELTTGCGVCSGVLDIVCVKCDKNLYENK